MDLKNINDFVEDKELNGQLIAFRKMIEKIEKENESLRELISQNKGCEIASNRIAEGIGGVISILQKNVDKGEMEISEAKTIRSYVQRSQLIALSNSEDARIEIAKLQGEGRRIIKQLQEIKNMYKMVISESSRKKRVEEEDENYRKEKEINVVNIGGKKKKRKVISKEK